ncbi:uncharacterized protein EI90DRAFT_3281699 [Cantharellus anzutake]|uniref:uncharacterized protein n=1 Tax=Cantharellus anzutake TaxID=1750568 RepID=UPI0019046BFD|nr:uncharacterized protein EI90DRAFT_3281699 [Cantharellus anzutake]KAF8326324.1 hypothetical protein EI90DRAFT_3281699 [Cantharellus anzutake]
MGDDLLDFVINHVFMPPKLPQEADESPERIDFLLSTIRKSMKLYKQQHAAPEHQALWDSLLKMVDTLRRINIDPEVGISECIKRRSTGDTIAIFVHAQNAGVIIRCGEEETIFENFEASPMNTAVMRCTGKLIRSFPGPAIALRNNVMQDPDFLEELAAFLTQMYGGQREDEGMVDGDQLLDEDTVDNDYLQDEDTINGDQLREEGTMDGDPPLDRGTTHPKYITELLTGILRGLGEPADIPRIQKRTSDDVLQRADDIVPWRRSSLWLVVRVALQTTIHRGTSNMNEYKSFMILLLAEILRSGVENRLPGHILYCMRAKLSRGLFKIRSWAAPSLVTLAHEVALDTERLLQDRWKSIQDAHVRAPKWAPNELDVFGDTSLNLKNCRSYISAALVPGIPANPNAAFQSHHPRSFNNLFDDEPGVFSAAVEANGFVALWDFERCVKNHIDEWVSRQISDQNCESACDLISHYMTTYADEAGDLYNGAPAEQSIMLLTLFELWMALDILTATICPLLKDYSPEVPLTLYEGLLLSKAEPLGRISRIQAYLRKRYHKAGSNPQSIFSEIVDAETFAVRFFDSSSSLQDLKRTIEQQAMTSQKLRELHLLKLEYREIMKRAGSHTVDRMRSRHNPESCEECCFKWRARALRTVIREWPLPQEPVRAKFFVFERAVPSVFKTWRETTYWLLRDICMPKEGRTLTIGELYIRSDSSEFPFGEERRVSTSRQRISLAPEVEIPDEEGGVTQTYTASCRLWDNGHCRWIYPPSGYCDLSHRTSMRIPEESPYASLGRFALGTSHTSNEVLASQHVCSSSLSLRSFVAFGSLRAGARLQWCNIAREIPSGNLSFQCEEVYDLISQAVCQVGCLSGDGIWECHQVLQEVPFGNMLLDVLEQLGTDIEGSWRQGITALTITTLASRLLVSAVAQPITNRTYKLLQKIRDTTLRWLHELLALQSHAETETERGRYRRAICQIAAVCRSSFDVDACHAGELLRTPEDVAIFIECAIILCSHSPQETLTKADPHLHQLLLRDKRLSCRMEELLVTRIQEGGTILGINEAISAVWNGIDPTCSWTRRPRPNDCWLTTAVDGQRTQNVHFNVLSGALLIDGKPPGWLPSDIRGHSIYKELFGARSPEVVSSDMGDMDYVSKAHMFSESQLETKDTDETIHFGWRDGRLIVRSRSLALDGKSCRILELLPREIFEGDLPSILVKEYFHWMELSTCQIELRPKNAPWTSSRSNWHLRRTACSTWVMDKGPSVRLVDCQSRTGEMICAILRSLEPENNILITLARSSIQELRIDLPRFQLSFALKGGKLYSLNFPGFEVDSNQSTGTMLGLRSQLVLRHSGGLAPGVELNYSRRVIIPMGDVSIASDGDHVAVTINDSELSRVKYCDYDVDVLLGRLVGDGSLPSALFQSLLHAVTSYCLPDPLTSLSGVEEAIQILRSARCKSFQSLGDWERQLLRRLSALTPSRIREPPDEWPDKRRWEWERIPKREPRLERWWHLTGLWENGIGEAVWNIALSPLVQHGAFWDEARSIFEWHNEMNVFDSSMGFEKLERDWKELHLLSRARCHNAVWYGPDLPRGMRGEDVIYESRDADTGLNTTRIRAASNASSLVYHCPLRLKTPKALLSHMELWTENIRGSSLNHLSDVRLGFSKEWLSLSMPRNWIPLYNACRTEGWGNHTRFKLLFSLSALGYSNPSHENLVPALLAFACFPEFRSIDPPPWPRYTFIQGYKPDASVLKYVIMASIADRPLSKFYDSPLWGEHDLDDIYNGHKPDASRLKDAITASIRRGKFSSRASSQVSFLVKKFIAQWDHEPTGAPTLPSLPDGDVWLINTSDAMTEVTRWFESWFRNRDLLQHIRAIQTVLDKHRTLTSDAPVLPIYSFRTSLQLAEVDLSIVSYSDVFLRQPPMLAPPPSPLKMKGWLTIKSSLERGDSLKPLISTLRSSHDRISQKYGADLEASRNALHDIQISTERVESLQEELYRDHQMYRSHLSHVLGQIRRVLNPDPQSERVQEVMRVAGLWPKSTTRSLLHHLSFSSRSTVNLSPEWKNVLVCLAQSILLWQRSERLVRLGPKTDEFLKECSSYPDLHDISDDWLLVQIDSNFLARPLQVDVAHNMMFPRSQDNTILQLNMGEGKSSVIVPLIAISLADGQQLVRVIVPKPLANQMFQSLVRRLSGLANRRIYCMPFSRAIATDSDVFQRIYHECMDAGGILVMQPEHVLSFKLTGIERQLSSARRKGTPDEMLKLQRWLDANVRDILDESDEILAVKCQLVYTVGTQQPLGPQPVRWTTVQHVFSILRSSGRLLHQLASQGDLELEQRDGCFPCLRILRHEAGVQILKSLLRGITQGESPDLPPFRLFHGVVRQEAEAFIAQRNPGKLDELRNHCRSDNHLWSVLLLLRGLFAHGILMYVLSERRWRVDYGLDLTRSRLAVPYRAKDVPALRAEFSHPDVCTSLTYLSYYYGGLSYDQLDMCFEHINELEDPGAEYRKWIKDNSLVPDFLCDYSSFNPDDREQKIHYLYPAFERNPATINFFLCQVVFPKEAKTFPQKLSTSGWDIAERRRHVTTGFSGTNDNRYLLPTSIQPDDIPAQLGTNAKVLNLMLRPENDYYQSAASSEFLDLIVKETPQIRVLLDVGAQMLEYPNKELASIWLSQVSVVDIDAAIFFSEDDEIFVIRRDGAMEPFISSSYRHQLDCCLVYLDDAHTRGTDLKLPADYRAAVTLGPKVTKDRLVQGCMRMRRLGKGHSVLFLAPPDVDRKIRKLSKKTHGERIGVYDVLSWSIRETCSSLRRYSCDWREQGIHYIDRQCAWKEFWTSYIRRTSVLAKYWLRPELKSLEEMYGAPSSSGPLEQEPSHPAADCREIKQRSEIFSSSTMSWLVKMAEEQEREVTHEPEREPEAGSPLPVRPARHRLHPDVVSFVRDGKISPSSRAFISLFSSVAILPQSQQHTKWSRNLLATSDFVTTIEGSNARKGIEFLRPVNWILSSIHESMLVVCSPFEVNELLPEIRRSCNIRLHVYSPRTSQPMRSFDDLKFYTIPSLPTTWTYPGRLTVSQLNIFSGQLYINNFETYLELCNFLGVNTTCVMKVMLEPPGQRNLISDRCSSTVTRVQTVYGIVKEYCALACTPRVPQQSYSVGCRITWKGSEFTLSIECFTNYGYVSARQS